jgi:hypothetical protein
MITSYSDTYNADTSTPDEDLANYNSTVAPLQAEQDTPNNSYDTQATDDYEEGGNAIGDIKNGTAQNNIDRAEQLINQSFIQQQDPWKYAAENVNKAMELYNDGNPAPKLHPIIGALLGTGLGAGLGYLTTSPIQRALGMTGQNMMLGGAVGGLTSVADIDKARNKYLNDKNAARKAFITKELENVNPKTTVQVANQGMQAQNTALKAQMPLDTAQFNYGVAKNYGYGNSMINPQTEQPYILNPTEQTAVNNSLGTETAEGTIVPQAQNTFDAYYKGKTPNAQSNQFVSNQQNTPDGTIAGGITEQNQDRQFHIGEKPSDLKMVTDQYSKGTQQAISKQKAVSTIQHQRVEEAQGQQRVNQGWVKTSAYAKNVDNLIQNRNTSTDIKKQAFQLKKQAAGMTDPQKEFAANYLQLKSGDSPEIQAKVQQALQSGKIKKSDVSKYTKNLTNSYLQKAQQRYMQSYGKDIETLFKGGTNKSNYYSPISVPQDFEPVENENETDDEE